MREMRVPANVPSALPTQEATADARQDRTRHKKENSDHEDDVVGVFAVGIFPGVLVSIHAHKLAARRGCGARAAVHHVRVADGDHDNADD